MTAAERRRRFHSNLSGVLALLMLDEEERISVVGACFKHWISVMKSSLVVLIKEKSRWWVDVEIGVEMRMENTGGKQTTAHRKWQTVLWVRYSARGEVDDKNKKLLSTRHLRKGQYWMNWCLNWRKPQATADDPFIIIRWHLEKKSLKDETIDEHSSSIVLCFEVSSL